MTRSKRGRNIHFERKVFYGMPYVYARDTYRDGTRFRHHSTYIGNEDDIVCVVNRIKGISRKLRRVVGSISPDELLALLYEADKESDNRATLPYVQRIGKAMSKGRG